MFLTLIFLPLITVLFINNKWIGKKYGPLLSILNLLISLILVILIYYEIGLNNSFININLGNWFNILVIKIQWLFLIDSLTISMYIPILLISFIVQIYSYNYMEKDSHIIRFYSYLTLFTFAMLILVTSDNFLLLFIGWELVGLISYLLVNFWFTRILANHSALKAFNINRLGDIFYQLSIIILLILFNDLSLSTLSNLVLYTDPNFLFILLLFLIGSALAKSGQFPLHIWLPNAMEGPTPVSALLHSATMVTAGIYLLIRISPILEYSNTNLMIILWIGGISSLFGAIGGLIENDIKKIIAYSTTSQLGYMMVACGISQYNLSLFHLLNHAFFKALLFLSAGAIIHSLNSEQDIRKMGNLLYYLPLSYISFFIGSFSIMAFPFFTGFYSKDYILESILLPYNYSFSFIYILTLLTAYITGFYSIRLLLFTFNNKKIYSFLIYESNYFILFPLILLNFGALFFGYFFNELYLGYGSTFINNSIFIHPNHHFIIDHEFHFSLFKFLPFLSFLFLFFLFEYKSIKIINLNISPYLTLLNDYNLYFNWLIHSYYLSSISFYRYIDKGLLEIIGPLGLIKLFHYLSFIIELLSSSFLLHYLFYILFSYLLYLWFNSYFFFFLFLYLYILFVFYNVKVSISCS